MCIRDRYAFELEYVRVHYRSSNDSSGSIEGSATQVLTYGSDGTTVTAIPDTANHYHFVSWSDGSTEAARHESDVAADATLTANFALDTHTLSYVAFPGGSIEGSLTQVLDYGSNGTTVTAKPGEGYHFYQWSDNVKLPSRLDTHITTDTALSAEFAPDAFAPMWRFYNKKKGTHFYTADPAERDNVTATLSATYNFEGVAWQVNTDDRDNSAPLYRFRNKRNGSYLYTADEGERAAVAALPATWALEGVASHVCATVVKGVTPVWRFRNKKTNTYFYTADETEKANVAKATATYVLEGVAFYLAP